MIKKKHLFLILLVILSCSKNDEELDLLTSDTEQLVFPDTPKLKESLLEISIENKSKESIKINKYSIPDGFKIRNLSYPLTINSQSSISLSIVFYPTETKLYEEELIIINDSEENPNLKIKLIGNGLPNHLNTLSFSITSQEKVDFLSIYDSVTIEHLTISDIHFDDPIISFESLENIKSVDRLTIFETHNTVSFEVFADIEINEHITISSRKEEDLSFLDDIIRNDISYFFHLNQNITDLSILESLENIDKLEVSSNQSITNLDALKNTKINSKITIKQNTNLRDLCGIKESAYKVETRFSDNGYNPTENDFETGNCRR
ncbi:hypothetical protein [Algibacter sp. R77976]|uniref:hypothetical protein n=1 Tax=Algibacter sp. R77976 TaxID=3093873 RepID=UPI0037CB0156